MINTKQLIESYNVFRDHQTKLMAEGSERLTDSEHDGLMQFCRKAICMTCSTYVVQFDRDNEIAPEFRANLSASMCMFIEHAMNQFMEVNAEEIEKARQASIPLRKLRKRTDS